MRLRRSPLLWFLLGALAMAVLGLVLALRLTGWSAGHSGSAAEVRPVIHIRNEEDVQTARRALTGLIYAIQQLPATLPEPSDEGLLVRLPNGFSSSITVSIPEAPNGALLIYHTGHEGYTRRDRAAIQTYLDAGYTVWRLDMPLTGANPRQVAVTLPSFGELTVRQHRQMTYLSGITDGHPLRYFVEPVVAAVNLAEAQGFTDIFMTGLSGGGWTTLLAAALDARIDASYPVAAGLPLGLRFDGPQRNWGDWEENMTELHAIASFEDLSILGAAGRSQIQVLNEYDLCCYNDPRYLDFAPALQTAVERLSGHFAIHWSHNEFLHRANPAALELILADMQSRRSP
jgi:hypothetical protein